MANNDLYIRDALLTTHALDIAKGRPAAGLSLELAKHEGSSTDVIARTFLNSDGRGDAPLLLQHDRSELIGSYTLTFDAGDYHGQPTLFDRVLIDFHIADSNGHYHVPLVLAPGGYSTYRGVPPTGTPRDDGCWYMACNTLDESAVVSASTTGGAGLSLHVIDTACGRAADGLVGNLTRPGTTSKLPVNINAEGRTTHWLVAGGELRRGHYELILNSGSYYRNKGFGVGQHPFITRIRVRLNVQQIHEHHHLVLIISPWGYSCYRGS